LGKLSPLDLIGAKLSKPSSVMVRVLCFGIKKKKLMVKEGLINNQWINFKAPVLMIN